MEVQLDTIIISNKGVHSQSEYRLRAALANAHAGIATGSRKRHYSGGGRYSLADDEIKELPHLLARSLRIMTVINYNLCVSMGRNFLATILAMTGLMGPVPGALVHNAGSVIVIISSTMLPIWREQP